MSTQYNGLPGTLISAGFPTAKTITDVTNTSPIVVTTSVAHALKTGDIIRVSGTGIQDLDNLAMWRAVVQSSTTVALYLLDTGTPSSALGTSATGTLQSYAWGTTYPIPSDGPGNPRSAASVNGAFEALGDRTSYLLYLMGGHIEPHLRFLQYRGMVEDDAGETNPSYCSWANTSYVDGAGSNPITDSFYCEVGDYLDVTLSIYATILGGDDARLQVQVDDGAGSSFVVMEGGRFFTVSAPTEARIHVQCHRQIANAGVRTVKVVGKTSAGNGIIAIGAGSLLIRHFRSVP
jgi:hypothetical protein